MKLLQARYGSEVRERGNALFVAIILLLLASVITLFTLRVGVFEQRTSGNDVRAKLISQVAEAGIAQGAEYFRANPQHLAHESGNWQLCAANDVSFPCGSVPETSLVDHDGDPATAPVSVARRATMWRWSGGGAGDNNNDGATDVFDARMLPLAGVMPTGMIESVGNFDQVSYGVGVVLCRVATPTSGTTYTRCATSQTEQSNTLVYNFVSVASLPGEGTRTTVSQMLGQYLIFSPNTNQPPIVASGTVNVTGGLQLVTNPNAGGNGVPVSVWTRKNLDKSGTPNTCYYDEFIRHGGGFVEWVGTESRFLACHDCDCPADKLLSYANSGFPQEEGIDILDIDGNTPATPITSQANYDVKPEEFPCDMFSFVFGVRARIDDDDDNGVHYLGPDGLPLAGESGDYFCEARIPKISYTNADNLTAMLNVDEAFLYDNATYIVKPRADGANVNGHTAPWTSLVTATQNKIPLGATGYPHENYSGIVWCQTGCDLPASAKLGTPDKPILLVADGPLTVKGVVYGLIFLRSLEEGDLSPLTGGTAHLRIEGNTAIYGSVVIQGEVKHAAGTAALIYSADVFSALAKSIPPKDSNLPGAWTDRLSY